jgi:peptidoglycan/LPS O-acetylase OafA/YrhL
MAPVGAGERAGAKEAVMSEHKNEIERAAAPGARLAFIDALKAFGAQFIVLHHLAFYGPMSDGAHRLAPGLMEWLAQDARIAVQLFLVVAGFLAAQSLAPDGVLRAANPLALLRRRYLRTALPYLVALVVSMACSALARHWMVHDSIPDAPELGQFLAHALLLHSVLDVESLSAGVWYVAIDFQLFALVLGLLWLARVFGGGLALASGLLLLGVVASLFGFNLDPDWDIWAPYFLGSYGLGVLAFWAGDSRRGMAGMVTMALLVLVVGLALEVDFRSRIAVALAVALALWMARRGGWLAVWPRSAVLAHFGQISYAVFLLNFPVSLVVTAIFTRFVAPDPWLQTAGVVLAWGACNLAGGLFYRWVEQPLGRWQGTQRRLLSDTGVTSSRGV